MTHLDYHAPYHYEHVKDGQHDHFFHEPTFDFDAFDRHPLSTNTGVDLNSGLFKSLGATFRTEQIFNDYSVDRTIEQLMRGEMNNAEAGVKMWESGIVDLVSDNFSAVVEHEKT